MQEIVYTVNATLHIRQAMTFQAALGRMRRCATPPTGSRGHVIAAMGWHDSCQASMKTTASAGVALLESLAINHPFLDGYKRIIAHLDSWLSEFAVAGE